MPNGSEVIFGNIRDGTRCTRTPSWIRSAGSSPRGVSGAMTMTSFPVRRRCSITRSTELVTPFTFGRKDSATMATRTTRDCHPRLSGRLRAGIRHAKPDTGKSRHTGRLTRVAEGVDANIAGCHGCGAEPSAVGDRLHQPGVRDGHARS